jgi:hypothetical protein
MRIDAATTYVVGDRLPWPDDDAGRLGKPDFEIARLHGGAASRDCAIRKISPLGAAISAEKVGETGDHVAIELASGQRCAARIDWSRGGEAGLLFDEPLDILALINRNLVAQPAERRALPRIELRCAARLKWGEHIEPALTRNISACGMQVEGDHLPPVGTYLAIYLDGLTLPPCEVVWRQSRLAGVEFFEQLSWASIIPWVKGLNRAAQA